MWMDSKVNLCWVAQPSSAIMCHMATRDASAESAEMRHKLAGLVRDRRLQLGLSVRSAADMGRVARGTWTALEEGTRRTADNNYAGVERALRWAPGSITAILAGGGPTIAVNITDYASATESVTVDKNPGYDPATDDEALIRVMRSDLPESRKRDLIQILIAEKERAERERVERAEELIRLIRGEV